MSRTQNRRRLFCDVNNRRFHTDSNQTAIDNHINASPQIFFYMFCRRRAWSAWRICTRCRHRHAGTFNQLSGSLMWRHPDSYRIKSTGCLIRHSFCLFKNKCHRSRPECIHKFFCRFRYPCSNCVKFFSLTDMKNQWIITRTPFCLIYFFSRLRVKSIPAKSIHSLRREGNQPALP